MIILLRLCQISSLLMNNEDKIARIKEICSVYEKTLIKANESGFDTESREIVNFLRQESLAEICELIREN